MQTTLTRQDVPQTHALASASSALLPASLKAIVLNYCSAVSLLVLGYLFYRYVPLYIGGGNLPWYQTFFSDGDFLAMRVVIAGYLLVLPLYYATYPDSYTVKCRHFWRALVSLPERWPVREQRVALRAVLVKMFYLPLMAKWVLFHAKGLADNVQHLGTSGDSLRDWSLVLYSFLFLADVLIFAIGYGVEHPRLRNEIRSVEPTLMGWAVTLGCYPPFVLFTSKILGALDGGKIDYPAFSNPVVQTAVVLMMMTLITIYAWASVALGFKASNLTYRGLVEAGPYRWVRHPAYAAKNTYWIMGTLAWLLAYPVTFTEAFFALCSMACWAFVYYMRAMTEEDHLSGQDPDYKEYCRRVPYRFIPGIW